MKEFEKSNVVRQGSPFNSALVFTFTAFSSSAVSETCISRWTTQFSFFIYFTSKFLFFLKLWPKGQNNRRNAVPDDVRRAGEEIKCLKNDGFVTLLSLSEVLNDWICIYVWQNLSPTSLKSSVPVFVCWRNQVSTPLCANCKDLRRACRNLSVSGDECGTILQKDARTSECSIINKKNPLLSGEGLKQSSFRSEVAI